MAREDIPQSISLALEKSNKPVNASAHKRVFTMNKQEAGRLGGIVTFLRYGAEGMAERGRQGGRPRILSLERQRQSQGAQINAKGVSDTPSRLSNNLRELKGLYCIRHGRLAKTKVADGVGSKCQT